MCVKKIIIFGVILLVVGTTITHAWTENGEWESGSSITWDVPYQAQKYFRNWTTSCMATSGAMIINFMYSGANISQFSGNSYCHIWGPLIVPYPYETTGQRVYSFGVISGNNYNGNLLDYLRNYPKNDISQYYCDDASCTNPYYGPLHNESLKSDNAPRTCTSVTNQGDTYGNIDALASYLSKKHYIEIVKLQDHSVTNIRNALYKGPVIISVWRKIPNESHVIVVKGVDSDGNFIINDPWGEDFYSSPGNEGFGKTYDVLQNGKLKAYGYEYSIKYAYSVPVYDKSVPDNGNFNRPVSPFSPWSIPVEAALTFLYDYDACENESENENYNGDGDCSHIRNGFVYWYSESGEWNYFYDISSVLGFPFTTTVQRSEATTFARWTPYFPRSGRYRVLVGFYAHSSNSSEVNYIVLHRDGQDTVTINQKNDTNAYEVRGNITYKSLGNYYFSNFGSVKVVNTSNVSGDINVDVVRFAYPPFPDINKNEWYYDYVLCLYDLGIVSGHPVGQFRPNEQVNRAEFIKMAVIALELSRGNELNRKSLPEAWDVKPDDWFKPFLEKAYAYKNYEVGFWFWEYERMAFWDTSIKPDWAGGITRKEAARIVMNALELEPYDSEVKGDFMFTDVGNNHPYKEYIYSIKRKDVIAGYDDNSFKPSNPVNRAEASKFIFKVLECLKYFDLNESSEVCQKCAERG